MDPSTTAQPNQPVPTQPATAPKAQPPVTSLSDLAKAQTPPSKQQISGHPEQGPIQSATPAESTDSEEVQPAKQEAGAPAASQSPIESGSTPDSQPVEVAPSMPEVAVEKSVENIVEKSPNTEQPKLSEAVKQAGVTFSGPGIPIDENVFAIKTMPVTYEEAVKEEKATKIKDSKHWLMAKIIYIWRKLNPDVGKEKKVQ